MFTETFDIIIQFREKDNQKDNHCSIYTQWRCMLTATRLLKGLALNRDKIHLSAFMACAVKNAVD